MTQPFQFPNGQLAYNADDLIALCKQFPDDGTNYLVREDLEKWLAYIGKNDIAQCAMSARQTALTDRQKLEEFLNKCHSLAYSQKAPATTIEEKASVEDIKVSQLPITENKINAPVETIKSLETIPETLESKPSTKEPNVVSPAKTGRKTLTKSANVKEEKPSFFQLIATLVINILYRDKN